MRVCQTDRLYHYLLGNADVLDAIITEGLKPLSELPASPRQAQLMDFYRQIYSAFAEPVLRTPYRNSGVFLTPIDFRQLPDSVLARKPRITLPLDAFDPRTAILTYEWEGRRVVQPCTAEHPEQTAALWPEPAVRDWFGRNQSMLFYHVPQVAVFPDGGIPVRREWVD